MTAPRRPLLARDVRRLLATLAEHADTYRRSTNSSIAYTQGVIDTLSWLTGDEPTPLFQEVVR